MGLLNKKSNEEKQAEKVALKEIDSYRDKTYYKFRQIVPRYGITKIGVSESRYFNKIIKTIKNEIKKEGLKVDSILPRVHELLTEKYGEPMSQEDANEIIKKPLIENEKRLEEKFGIQFQDRIWFKCTIEEMKRSTFTNTNNRNVDSAYVFIEDTFIEIVKESVFLKSNMGTRKIFYENITSIDYDARGKLHMSNSLVIHLKSSENIQLKNVQEKMVNILNNSFEEYINNKIGNSNETAVNNEKSNADELIKYAELYEKGLLSEEEFTAMKKKLLGL